MTTLTRKFKFSNEVIVKQPGEANLLYSRELLRLLSLFWRVPGHV